MRIPRLYHPHTLQVNTIYELDKATVTRLSRVLRIAINAEVILFNGQGGEYQAQITKIEKHKIQVKVKQYRLCEIESPLAIHLGQVIARSSKMDFIIQKAVELGVSAITPLFSERCGVKLDAKRRQNRMQHWQGIIISACEQCGRDRLPTLNEPQILADWIAEYHHNGVLLDPLAKENLHTISKLVADDTDKQMKVNVLIGPEGGLTAAEIAQAQQVGFHGVNLGPRILRTETAGLTVISILQHRWGDL